ncbi:MAG: hypothetical protein J5I93_07755, partial [Pirellulaceae bacterium]|nr:hypothetical protein [Pirellulaceae bacterium]
MGSTPPRGTPSRCRDGASIQLLPNHSLSLPTINSFTASVCTATQFKAEPRTPETQHPHLTSHRPRARRERCTATGTLLRNLALPIFALLAALPSAIQAQPFPLDPVEFQVNSYTPGPQYAGDVAIQPNGDFVVVWTSTAAPAWAGDDSDGWSVHARRFDTHGYPIGGQFQVNTYTTGNQGLPRVATREDGAFLIVWASDVGSTGGAESWSIFGRLFAMDGSPLLTQEIQLNEYTTGEQILPDVAARTSGDFVVAWSSRGSFGTDSDRRSVQARRVDAHGLPVEPAEFQVNVYTTDSQFFPRVAPGFDGGFVVTWTSWGSFGTDQSMYSVLARRYSAEGQPLDTPEFQVNTLTGDYQWNSDIASSPSGDFVIVWENWIDPVGDDHIGIRARRFAASGTPLDPTDFQINTYTSGGQGPPKVAANSEGDFVVTWPSVGSFGTDTDGDSVQVRRYRADGTAVDSQELQANVFTIGHQIPRSVAAGPDGDFVVTWRSAGSFGDDTDGSSVQARRFGRPRIAVTSTAGRSEGPDCTLVDAVEAASSDQPVGGCPAGSGGGVVQLPAGSTIGLNTSVEGANALPIIRRSVTLEGRGAVVRRDPGLPCDGTGGFRLAEVVDGGVLTLQEVTLEGGCPPAGESGGAVLA